MLKVRLRNFAGRDPEKQKLVQEIYRNARDEKVPTRLVRMQIACVVGVQGEPVTKFLQDYRGFV